MCGLQRLDAQQLVRAVDERPHRQGNPALRRPLHQDMGEKLLKLHGFHAPKQRMMHIVQGNHILNDAIGMPLADTRLHHVERHTPAEEAADEDRGRVTPRALFAERRVHRSEQQPIPAPVHPKGDAPVERRLVCRQGIVLLLGIE